MTPTRLREVVSKNHNRLFYDIFDDKDYMLVKSELDNFYWFLCDFVHPTLIKSYIFRIQNEHDVDNIKHIMKINLFICSFILLVGVLSINGMPNIDDVTDLFILLYLFNLSLVNRTDELKRILNKYKKYLYFDFNSEYIKNKSKELDEVKTFFEKLKNISVDKDNVCKKIINIFKKYEIDWYK